MVGATNLPLQPGDLVGMLALMQKQGEYNNQLKMQQAAFDNANSMQNKQWAREDLMRSLSQRHNNPGQIGGFMQPERMTMTESLGNGVTRKHFADEIETGLPNNLSPEQFGQLQNQKTLASMNMMGQLGSAGAQAGANMYNGDQDRRNRLMMAMYGMRG
jgi:hypothetical protein